MPWKPGLPVMTAEDHAAWLQWRNDRKREQQRQRRASHRRIDYYPDDLAADVIDANTGRWAGGDYSSVLNRIVAEWCHRNKQGPSATQRDGTGKRTP